MASLKALMARYGNDGVMVGEQLKAQSDYAMDETFDNDIPARQGYLYDFFHDDIQTRYTLKLGKNYVPPAESGKIPVKVKFLIKEYKSLSKDEPSYYIQFQMQDWNTVDDQASTLKPDWWSGYESLGITFPVGMYIDLPDDHGCYYRWLIVYQDVANQFPKFGVLRCNYVFDWVTNSKKGKILRRFPGVERTQNSYNSGLWAATYSTRLENQAKALVPFNRITSQLTYNNRIVVSMPMDVPLAWTISKVQNTKPKGIIEFTLYQSQWDPDSDYVDKSDPIVWKMYCNYKDTATTPQVQDEITPDYEPDLGAINITATTTTIKVNGSYKVLTLTAYNDRGDTVELPEAPTFQFTIDDNNINNLVQTKQGSAANKFKIKFLGDEQYIGKVLHIKVTSGRYSGQFNCDIIVL